MTSEFEAVQKTLSRLPAVIQQKVVVGAARAASRVIAKKAKELAPVDTGLLKKSIGIAKAKKKDTDPGHVKFYIVPKSVVSVRSKVSVGGRSGKLKAKVRAYHAHFLEFGTKNMAAKPYLLPAAKATTSDAVKAFREYVHNRVPVELKKIAS
jgi:HK97 gp10 family phage protein